MKGLTGGEKKTGEKKKLLEKPKKAGV